MKRKDQPASQSRRGRPKAMPDEKRREEILKAAYSVFLELGFARTTTDAIAAKAKTSKRLIYTLFADKTELFAEVIAQHRHVVLDLPQPPGSKGDVLRTLIKIFRLDISGKAARERDAVLSLMVRESVLSPELSTHLYEHKIISFREDLVEWLNSAKAVGTLSFEDVDVSAGMLMDIVFGALLPRRPLRTAAAKAVSITHIKKRLEIFVRGAS